MLKELFVENIVLIESSTLTFDQGLHVFSGETGAGKTAILQALRLILGTKADYQLIRRGADRASVKALFELDQHNPAFKILQESGIMIEDDNTLLIHRELHTTGKGKTYINNQLAQVSILKQISRYLMELVAQHASHELLDPNTHQAILDTFAQNDDLLHEVQIGHSKLQQHKKELLDLRSLKEEQTQKQQIWNAEFEEIDNAQIENALEEETLFCEYEKLSSTQELTEALSKLYYLLQEDDHSVISALQKESNALDRLNLKDPEFQKLKERMSAQVEELREISFECLQYKDSLDENPERLQYINERLQLLKKLTKRFGPQLSDVIAHREKLSEQLQTLSEFSQNENQLLEKIYQAQQHFDKLCEKLSLTRNQAAQKLQKEIQVLLEELNLPNAQLIVELSSKSPDAQGKDSVEFFLHANVGENKAALKDRASGGELSRVLLALKVLLFDLEKTPTLIFDEIDSGVGGQTAPKLGKMLKKMSRSSQLIVITHLPQIAAFADQHFEIKKIQESSRTFSLVQRLDEKQKVLEIERMLGGQDLSKNTRKLAEDLIQKSF